MKEIIIKLFKDTFWNYSPIKLIVDKFPNILTRLFIALQLWCVNLSIYFTCVFVAFCFYILTGQGNFFSRVWWFTKLYFYNGDLLGFVAWRVHITLYIICLLITFKE